MNKLFTILALMLATLTVQASTYYGFKIGGVSVNSDNCNNVTGSNIQGSVKYDYASNTVTLTNVTIERSGSDNRAIYNESNSGLIVKLVGTNYLSATDAAPVRLQRTTTIIVSSGITRVIGGSEGGIYISGAYKLTINGPGELYVQANSKGGIEGSSDANTLEFSNVKASVFGGGGCLLDIYAVTFKANSNVHLYGAVQNVKNVDMMIFEGKEVIQSPSNATFNPSTKSVAYYNFNTNSFGENVSSGVRIDDDGVVALMNDTYFPDATFQAFLKKQFSKFFINTNDVNSTTSLAVPSNGISSLQGIEYFTALQSLKCNGNNIQSLDVTNFPALTTLNCNNNKLTSLNLSQNYNLKELNCSSNKLTTLNLSNNTKLESLQCHCNNISGSGAANFVQALPSRSNNNPLSFYFWFPSTSTNENNELTWAQVQTIRAKGWYPQEYYANGSISEWQDYDGVVYINSTYFPDAAFRSAITLTDSNGDGKLTSAERKTITFISFIANCGISDLTGIEYFAEITWIYCQINELEELDFSNNTKLNWIACHENKLSSAAIDRFIASLPPLADLSGIVCYYYPSAREHNARPTRAQVQAAVQKGWKLQEYHNNGWQDITGLDKVGDINGDNSVDVSDVNIIINIMLGKASANDYPGNADVTGDGNVDVSDVNAVINIMLGKR